MKKRYMIASIPAVLAAVIIVIALFFMLRPSRSVWDIAECVGRDDDFYVWIGDAKSHNHFDLTTDPPQDAKAILDSLKLSQRSIGNRTFFDSANMIVLEVSDHRVQYFLFNEDFTVVWAADNSWIYENTRGTQDNDSYHAGMIFNASEQYNEWGNTECNAYRVRDPRTVRKFFEAVCEQDDKYGQ